MRRHGKLSAGTVLFKREDDQLLVLLVHMGGPFWARKDEHAWSIPKGEYETGEDPHAVAAPGVRRGARLAPAGRPRVRAG